MAIVRVRQHGNFITTRRRVRRQKLIQSMRGMSLGSWQVNGGGIRGYSPLPTTNYQPLTNKEKYFGNRSSPSTR